VRLAGDDFERFAVNTCHDQDALLERIQMARQSCRQS
jgi:hypothetical protein